MYLVYRGLLYLVYAFATFVGWTVDLHGHLVHTDIWFTGTIWFMKTRGYGNFWFMETLWLMGTI